GPSRGARSPPRTAARRRRAARAVGSARRAAAARAGARCRILPPHGSRTRMWWPVCLWKPRRPERRHAARADQEQRGDEDELVRDLALPRFAAEAGAEVRVRVVEGLRVLRLDELAARQRGDGVQRRRVGRYRDLPTASEAAEAARQLAAAQHAVRRSERDGVNGDPGSFGLRGALLRREDPAVLLAVGEEDDRSRRLRAFGVVGDRLAARRLRRADRLLRELHGDGERVSDRGAPEVEELAE